MRGVSRVPWRSLALTLLALACAACGNDAFNAAPHDGGADAAPATDAATGDAGGIDAGDPLLASDTFSRNIAGTFGVADVGGAWSVPGGASSSSFAVDGTEGTIVIGAAGQAREAWLAAVTTDDADVELTTWIDKAPTGAGFYVELAGRRVNETNAYRGVLIFRSDGTVTCSLAYDPGSVTIAQADTGLTASPGERLRARFQASGRSPTRLRIKVWKTAAAEPTGWTLDKTDDTASLQVAGTVGVYAYLSGSATTAPVTASIDDFLARVTSRVP